MNVEKHGFPMRLSVEQVTSPLADGFFRKGHYEPVTPTPEQIALHARAVEAVKEMGENPYVYIGGYDWDFDVKPLETERWVHDETEEEWLARYEAAKAAGELPEKPHRTPFAQAIFDQVLRMEGKA